MAFAKDSDVAARLGRDITDAESTALTFLLEAASALICEAVERREEAIDPPPPVLKYVAVELALRAWANPKGIVAETKTLGAYSRTEDFRPRSSGSTPDKGFSLQLTNVEELMVRRAVWGRTTISQRVESHIDDIYSALIGS